MRASLPTSLPSARASCRRPAKQLHGALIILLRQSDCRWRRSRSGERARAGTIAIQVVDAPTTAFGPNDCLVRHTSGRKRLLRLECTSRHCARGCFLRVLQAAHRCPWTPLLLSALAAPPALHVAARSTRQRVLKLQTCLVRGASGKLERRVTPLCRPAHRHLAATQRVRKSGSPHQRVA